MYFRNKHRVIFFGQLSGKSQIHFYYHVISFWVVRVGKNVIKSNKMKKQNIYLNVLCKQCHFYFEATHFLFSPAIDTCSLPCVRPKSILSTKIDSIPWHSPSKQFISKMVKVRTNYFHDISNYGVYLFSFAPTQFNSMR